LRLAVQAADIGMWDYDPVADILSWDVRCKALFGLPPDAGVTYEGSFLAGLHPDDRERTAKAVDSAIQSGAAYDIEYRTIGLTDKIERWVAAKGKPIQKDGQTVRFIGTVMDITPRKRAERRFEIATNTGAAVAAELDLDRIVQIVTDAGVEMTGAQFGAFFYNVVNERGESYTLYTLSGVPRSAFEQFPMPRNTAVFAPTFNGEGVVRSDDIRSDPRYGQSGPHYGMPEGHLPVRSYLAVPVMSRSGEVLGGLFFGHSDTGRFDAESEALVKGVAAQASVAIDNARLYAAALAARVATEKGSRSTAEQFRLLVDGVVDYAIYMLDPEGHVNTWNAGAQRIKGYQSNEVVGQHFSMFYMPEDREIGEPGRLLEVARTEGRVEAEGRRLRKDGSTFWASVVIDAVRNDAGDLVGFAKVTRDISAQRRAAEEIEAAREALFQAQKMESIGQLTGGIAHDFNNMLSGIIGGLRMLERKLDAAQPDEARRYIALVSDAAQRAATLTSRLLAFGRRQSLDVRSVNVVDALRAVASILRSTVVENIVVEVQAEEPEIFALADLHQLESAVLNLAINGRDAMPEGGRLTLTAARKTVAAGDDVTPGEHVSVAVIDTGVGMSPEVMARALEPFFTTKPVGAGTGLGLSMVYGFVNQVGGKVELKSAPGAGTTVTLLLQTADRPETNAAPYGAAAGRGSGESILLVEDDPQVRRLVADLLQELSYEIREAANAEQAISILEGAQVIDLMISDVGLPGIDGRQLADIARRARPDLPILFLTGYAAQAADRSAFLGPGMTLLTKPFDVDILAAKVAEMLRGRSAHA
jgi:PAS domain S-box-containing protein